MAESRTKPEPRPCTAPQRVQAVLAIWTERRRPAEICRELAITPKVLSQWETRALAGMLQALELEPRRDAGPALSPKLERLLAQQARDRQKRLAHLAQRLTKLQEPKAPLPAPK
ncbi:MAG: hypothetical protein ACM33U_00155 [Solirubrobacterales bacterium]